MTFINDVDNKHYIRASNVNDSSSNILGVVSDTAGFLLNTYEEEWQGTYINRYEERDEDEYEEVEDMHEEIVKSGEEWILKKSINNRMIMEEVNVLDDNDEVIRTKMVPKIKDIRRVMVKEEINPLYDDTRTYIPRSQRKE